MEFKCYIELDQNNRVKKFKSTLEQIRVVEVQYAAKKISNEELELVELVTGRVVEKMIMLPVAQIKNETKSNRANQLSVVLNELFNLKNNVKP